MDMKSHPDCRMTYSDAIPFVEYYSLGLPKGGRHNSVINHEYYLLKTFKMHCDRSINSYFLDCSICGRMVCSCTGCRSTRPTSTSAWWVKSNPVERWLVWLWQTCRAPSHFSALELDSHSSPSSWKGWRSWELLDETRSAVKRKCNFTGSAEFLSKCSRNKKEKKIARFDCKIKSIDYIS